MQLARHAFLPVAWSQGAHIQLQLERPDGARHKVDAVRMLSQVFGPKERIFSPMKKHLMAHGTRLTLSDAVEMLRTREAQRAQHQAVIR